jgi:hypothetical protein
VHVYEATEKALEGVRSHPWQTAIYDPTCRYYDFKTHPELIPTVLEDFMPWAKYPAIQDFYSYLAWLNGPDSELESNDCAFAGVKPNISPNVTPSPLQATGRLMLFFRSLMRNCEQTNAEWLYQCFLFYLKRVQSDFQLGVVGLSRTATEFVTLNRRQGTSLVFNFWSWGENEAEVMGNLQRVVSALREASIEVCTDMRNANAGVGQGTS